MTDSALQYNFVLSASWSAAIAIAGVIIFFGIQWTNQDKKIAWWGTSANMGCEAVACTRLHLKNSTDYFGKRLGTFH